MANEKISAMPTLENPPLAPVFDAVITNDGTTATNFQRPQGVIVQPAAVDTPGLGVTIKASVVTNTGTGGLYAAATSIYGADLYITGSGNGVAGNLNIGAGSAYLGTIAAAGALFVASAAYINAGGTMAGGNFSLDGGEVVGSGTNTYIAGSLLFRGGNAQNQGGSLTFQPGTGATIGNLIINNLRTADPGVLNAAFLGVSNGITLSAG